MGHFLKEGGGCFSPELNEKETLSSIISGLLGTYSLLCQCISLGVLVCELFWAKGRGPRPGLAWLLGCREDGGL